MTCERSHVQLTPKCSAPLRTRGAFARASACAFDSTYRSASTGARPAQTSRPADMRRNRRMPDLAFLPRVAPAGGKVFFVRPSGAGQSQSRRRRAAAGHASRATSAFGGSAHSNTGIPVSSADRNPRSPPPEPYRNPTGTRPRRKLYRNANGRVGDSRRRPGNSYAPNSPCPPPEGRRTMPDITVLGTLRARPSSPHYSHASDEEDALLARVLITSWSLASGRTLRSDVPPQQLTEDELIAFWADDADYRDRRRRRPGCGPARGRIVTRPARHPGFVLGQPGGELRSFLRRPPSRRAGPQVAEEEPPRRLGAGLGQQPAEQIGGRQRQLAEPVRIGSPAQQVDAGIAGGPLVRPARRVRHERPLPVPGRRQRPSRPDRWPTQPTRSTQPTRPTQPPRPTAADRADARCPSPRSRP